MKTYAFALLQIIFLSNLKGKLKQMTSITKKKLLEKIFTIRGMQVMIDRDLAELYQVEVKRLNEQVKRNIKRFPINFMFQLNNEEWAIIESKNKSDLRSQIATAKRRTAPYVFTEQGVAMLSAVLNSEFAINVSLQVMNAFVEMRRELNAISITNYRLEKIEAQLLSNELKFEQLFEALDKKEKSTSQGVFFDGQLFDAYIFVTKLIKSANSSLILIDNYIDESTLLMLSKRKASCSAVIYTPKISNTLKLDISKHNSQYPFIEIKQLNTAHDRFLIIDNQELYHIGASLKDLGKKWFAFSKLTDFLPDVISKLEKSS